jgi:hypothetical protein
VVFSIPLDYKFIHFLLFSPVREKCPVNFLVLIYFVPRSFYIFILLYVITVTKMLGIMALGLTQLLTENSTSNLSGG